MLKTHDIYIYIYIYVRVINQSNKQSKKLNNNDRKINYEKIQMNRGVGA